MDNVITLPRKLSARHRRLSELMEGLESTASLARTEARFRLVRAALEAMEAYARHDGPEEARRLAELAITRASKPRDEDRS